MLNARKFLAELTVVDLFQDERTLFEIIRQDFFLLLQRNEIIEEGLLELSPAASGAVPLSDEYKTLQLIERKIRAFLTESNGAAFHWILAAIRIRGGRIDEASRILQAVQDLRFKSLAELATLLIEIKTKRHKLTGEKMPLIDVAPLPEETKNWIRSLTKNDTDERVFYSHSSQTFLREIVESDSKEKKKELLEDYARKYTKNSFYHYNYGDYLFSINEFKEAATHFRYGVPAVGESAVTRHLLARLYSGELELLNPRELQDFLLQNHSQPEYVAGALEFDGRYGSAILSNILLRRDFIKEIVLPEINPSLYKALLEDVSLNIRDYSTSDFHGRFYTVNLELALTGEHHQELFKFYDDVKSIAIESLPEDFPNKKNITDSSLVWADLSSTVGNSHILPHLHTAGSGRTYYLTAVIYLAVPSCISEGSHAGWLKFGGDAINEKQSQISCEIRPARLKAVLFPPYFYHSTIPCDTNDRRISMNIDFGQKFRENDGALTRWHARV